MEPHYVCKACGGVSEAAGTCQTQGCSQNNQPLEACSCTDGKHGAAPEEGTSDEKGPENQ